MESYSFFLPTRKGSIRIPNKNTKPFVDIQGGLLELKIKELLKIKGDVEIVLSTNDSLSIEIASRLSKDITIDYRPEHLCTSTTKIEDFISYIPKLISSNHIFWIHATAPFVLSNDYMNAIETYFNKIQDGFDSLMSVTKIQQFLWDKDLKKIVNNENKNNKWPQTQDLKPLFEINHAFYISSKKNYLKLNDRIGSNPYLFELDHIKSIDIDWEEDFRIAEAIYEKFFRDKI